VLVAVSGNGCERLMSPSPFDHYFTKPVRHDVLLRYLGALETRPKPSCQEAAVA
jgi:hypothetical protein